jgi:ketosteroid isomerase-like protein
MMVTTESTIASLLDDRSRAIHDKDIDRLLAFYSDDVVYFDVVPPLQYVGAAALRGRFLDWFARWKGAIGQKIEELHVTASADVAVAHMLIRAGGTLVDGGEVGYWVRSTSSFRLRESRWLITHEHVSLPANLKSGTVVTDLAP